MGNATGAGAERVRDVVCGMMIDRSSAAGTSTVSGLTFYFCSAPCKTKFDAKPGQFGPELSGEKR